MCEKRPDPPQSRGDKIGSYSCNGWLYLAIMCKSCWVSSVGAWSGENVFAISAPADTFSTWLECAFSVCIQQKPGYNPHMSFSMFATTTGPKICETKKFFFYVCCHPQHKFSEAETLTTRINQSVLYLYQAFKDRTPVIISDILLSFFLISIHMKKLS